MQEELKTRISAFEHKQPEIIFNWKDPETEAEGWAVINSLRGGAAGGGTRMRKGLNLHEVVSLAKTMEVKFSVCGPQIGGGKSGINFDPKDPRKEGVLQRWYKALLPMLKTYYGTGGDVNVDEIREVLPITGKLGLRHCQEGIAVGHFGYDDAGTARIIKRLQDGVSLPLHNLKYTPEPGFFTCADMITGWGVAEAVRHFYKIWNKSEAGKRVIVQGFGNVAGAAAWYLSQAGYKIVGIIDISGGIIRPEGISPEEITHLLLSRDGNQLKADHLIPFGEANEKIWEVGAEVFLPCALSRIVTTEQVDAMLANGLEVISSGANVPFDDPEIFMGETSVHADDNLSVIPDFIANCGMARAFAYFMGDMGPLTEEDIFNDVSAAVRRGLEDIHREDQRPVGLWQTGLKIALGKLMQESNEPKTVL
ncbi:MAG: amino acid dehydrogenase [Bacteroidia bacterium]|nr:amino acid dehydrogenase [Bacteroidia bacterium]